MKLTFLTIALTALAGTTLAQGGTGGGLGNELLALMEGSSTPTPTPTPTSSMAVQQGPLSSAAASTAMPTLKRRVKRTLLATATPSSSAMASSSAVPSPTAGVMARLEKLLF